MRRLLIALMLAAPARAQTPTPTPNAALLGCCACPQMQCSNLTAAGDCILPCVFGGPGSICVMRTDVLRWVQGQPPPVESYVVWKDGSPFSGFAALDAIPEPTPQQWHYTVGGIQYGDHVQLQACNDVGCSDLSNDWPTPTQVPTP